MVKKDRPNEPTFGTALPEPFHEDLWELCEKVDKVLTCKYGVTPMFWHIVAEIKRHTGETNIKRK